MPLGHAASVEGVVDAVLFLVKAKSVTGQMIADDSGQHLSWKTPDVSGDNDARLAHSKIEIFLLRLSLKDWPRWALVGPKGDIMKKLLTALFCASVSLHSTTAFAGERAYVSKNGSGAACSQAAPCATFQAAITAAGVDGEIICLDSGFFGSFAITASVTINCENHIGQAGATINTVTLPANGVVVLNGIDIDERNFGGNALNFTGLGTLILRHSSIRNATIGLKFVPTGNAKLVVANSTFEDNTNAGILIEPAGAGTVDVDMDGLKSTNNFGGVAVIATAGRTVNLEIRNSLLAQNSNYGFYGRGAARGELCAHRQLLGFE